MQDDVTVIAPDSLIEGTLSTRGDVHVLGRFEGSLRADGRVVVFEDAVVVADIVASGVRVDGLIEGSVRAYGRVSVGARGRLHGDVDGNVTVEEGGVFRGNIIAGSVTSGRRKPVTARRVYEDVIPPRAPSTGRIPSISEADISDALLAPAPLLVDAPPRPTPPTPQRSARRRRGGTHPGVARPEGAGITPPVMAAVPDHAIRAAQRARSPVAANDVDEEPRSAALDALGDAWFQEDDEFAD